MAALRGVQAGRVLVFAGGILLLFVYLFHVQKYWFVADDACISFRYARHWVDGLGLVWNENERVEGYTNFLWMTLTALGMRLGVAAELLAPVMSVLAGLGVLITVAALEARERGWADPRILLAPAVLAVHKSFCGWSTSGLETMFFAALVLWGMLALEREYRRPELLPWRSALLFALATLTRPDAAIFMVVAGCFVLYDVIRRRRTLKSALLWGGLFLAIVGAHLLWRYGYYGHWLPNTFYAKVNIFSWGRSTAYLWRYLGDYQIAWFAPLLLLGCIWRPDRRIVLFTASIIVFLGYVIYVGGDFLEYRFLVVLYAPTYWLLCRGIALCTDLPGQRGARALASLVAALAFTALLGTTYRVMSDPNAMRARGGNESIEATRRYGELRANQGRLLRDYMDRGLLPESLRIETGAAGALPYLSDVWTLDKRGLNDEAVARTPVKRVGRIGHEREASLEYIQQRDAVVVLLLHELIVRGSSRALRDMRTKALAAMARRNKVESSRGFELRFVCRELEPNTVMFFGTNVSEARVEEMLGHLRPC